MKALFLMLCGHAVADFMLQHPWVAQNKNRHFEPTGYDPKLHGPKQTIWPYVLTAHALTHGAFVFLATGSLVLGLGETLSHWLIASLLGYCSIRCMNQALVAPLVAQKLLLGAVHG